MQLDTPHLLPPEARRAFQQGTIVLEASVVRSNWQLGVGLKF